MSASAYPSIPPANGATFTKTIHQGSYPFVSSANHKGRHVFITGGSRGVGRAIALSFARAGARAIAIGELAEYDTAQLSSDLGTAAAAAAAQSGRSGDPPPTVLHARLDVADPRSVRAAAEAVRAGMPGGRLDVVINNAGFMTPASAVPESDEDAWWRTLEVNLRGPYLVAKYFLPMLLGSGGDGSLKTIVNINSVAAHNLRPQASAYGTSKLAVLKLTEFLLVEAAEKGLLAYSVHPGGVLTKLAEDGMPEDTLSSLGDDPRLAGDTVAWLTETRREWLAGRYLSCTWDMEEVFSRKDEIVKKDMLKVRLVLDS